MTRYSTWGIPYTKACELINALNSENITAYITAGGVAIHPKSPEEINQMQTICSTYGTTAVEGNTLHQDMLQDRVHGIDWGSVDESKNHR